MAGRWTKKEVQVLLEVSKSAVTLASQMYRLPGRTFEGAKCYASKHGIALTRSSAWTTKEVEILTRAWRGAESLKVALARELPHRSYVSARTEAQRLGLTAESARGRKGRKGYSWLLPSIARVLSNGGCLTVAQIAREIGANPRSIGAILRAHHGSQFRIGDWVWPSDKWAACWSIGGEPDAPKPAPKGARASCRDYQRKVRARKSAAVRAFASIAQQVAA